MLEVPERYGLPAPSWREYQREKTEEVLAAFERSKYVLLDAPTGSGKSIMAAAAACAEGWSAAYLTETINLQHQYLRTLEGATTVTGRRNHICKLGQVVFREDLTAEEGPCPCDHAWGDDVCSYYQQWWDCQAAQHAVLNYAFAVRAMRVQGIKYGTSNEHLPNPFKNRSLMVCDEGHLLERALLAAAGVDISARTLQGCGLAPPMSDGETGAWLAWAGEHQATIGERAAEGFEAIRNAIRTAFGMSDRARKEARRWRSLAQTVRNLQDLRTDTPIICQRTPTGWSLRPVWVWGQAGDLLFCYGQRVLIMSATLGAPWLMARLLGLPEDAVETVQVPHTFPVDNRLVFFWPVAKMKHGMPEGEKVRQAMALDYIASLGNFAHQKGVVHCNSYELGEFLYANVSAPTRARILKHTSANREEVFEHFTALANDNPAILLSPAATTGVDWPYHVGWQMIPKMPFADLSDQLVRARFEYVDDDGTKLGRIVYAHEAACQVVQACGRCTRAADDKGVTIITDENFWANYRHTAQDAYPEWFRESVRRYKPQRR